MLRAVFDRLRLNGVGVWNISLHPLMLSLSKHARHLGATE